MGFQRITIRSIDVGSVERLRHLRQVTRLPLGALVENAISELWDWYEQNGWHLDGRSVSEKSGLTSVLPKPQTGTATSVDRAHA